MSKYYAQLNESGKVHTVCQLSGEIEGENIVEISSMDGRLIGKKYKSGKFYGLELEAEKDKVKVNEEVKITIKWQDLEETLVDDKSKINVFVNEEKRVEVVAENGVTEIEFSSEETGIFEITAICEDGCKAMIRIGVVEDA